MEPCSPALLPEDERLSEADGAAFFRVGTEDFGLEPEGFSESRCNMFFKLLRIDFERFSAMRAIGQGIVQSHSITRHGYLRDR